MVGHGAASGSPPALFSADDLTKLSSLSDRASSAGGEPSATIAGAVQSISEAGSELVAVRRAASQGRAASASNNEGRSSAATAPVEFSEAPSSTKTAPLRAATADDLARMLGGDPAAAASGACAGAATVQPATMASGPAADTVSRNVASAVARTLEFNIIPSRAFAQQMLRMPRYEGPCDCTAMLRPPWLACLPAGTADTVGCKPLLVIVSPSTGVPLGAPSQVPICPSATFTRRRVWLSSLCNLVTLKDPRKPFVEAFADEQVCRGGCSASE